MKAAIRQRAIELGFDDCRFTTAQPPESAAHFQRWLRQGCNGEMRYLERNAGKRVDPQLVLRGAKSIITLAASYSGEGTGQAKLQEGASATFVAHHASRITHHAGIIARYARFYDYHHVIGDRLNLLLDFLIHKAGPEARSLWYVDTGPVLERDLAQRAGLGFIGKHTNLISRKFGNWIFLAEILTTVAFDSDEPEKNRCGSCTRCIAACPTAAITGPFQLDGRRCISYLTIELKGPIPVELRPAVGNRIYGCDDCLEVCPWNRFAREGSLMKELARSDLAAPDLVELLGLDEAGFRKRFERTPMLRTRRTGLLRNVCVALGNVGDKTALPALERAAADPEPLIAEHAAWAIAQIRRRFGENEKADE